MVHSHGNKNISNTAKKVKKCNRVIDCTNIFGMNSAYSIADCLRAKENKRKRVTL